MSLPVKTKTSPDREKLFQSFYKALRTREKILPVQDLNDYISSIMEKREVFIESINRFGSPQYFFDEPSLIKRIETFKTVFSKYFKRLQIYYAMKSNSFEGICNKAVDSGIRLDVSSGLELSRALKTGCPQIIFSGPGKTEGELGLAILNRKRVTILVDSFSELDRLSRLTSGLGDKDYIRIGVRVYGGNLGSWNKFGIPLNDLALFLKKASLRAHIKPMGIQFHASWNMNPGSQITMIKNISDYIKTNVPVSLWSCLTFLDIGGGYWPEHGEWLNPENTLKGSLIKLLFPSHKFDPVQYYRKSVPLENFAREISNAIFLQGKPLSEMEIWAEPGRWLSNPSMHILLQVIDKKNSAKVITDGGNNILGWESPLYEFIPILNISNPSTRRKPCMVFGSLCTPQDIWGTSFYGEKIEEGDILAIPNQGAYTYSLRQSFIKPISRVVRYDGIHLEEMVKEETFC